MNAPTTAADKYQALRSAMTDQQVLTCYHRALTMFVENRTNQDISRVCFDLESEMDKRGLDVEAVMTEVGL